MKPDGRKSLSRLWNKAGTFCRRKVFPVLNGKSFEAGCGEIISIVDYNSC